jgi:hypothetical protein
MASSEAIKVDPAEYASILRSLKNLPKGASDDLRQTAIQIADSIMVPSIQSAISQHAGNYASKLNQAVKAGRDRIPKVTIGSKSVAFSGGASTNFIRFGTIKGVYQSQPSAASTGRFQFWAQGVRPGWTDTAANSYTEPTFQAWQNGVNDVVDKWNRGVDY